MENRKVEGIMYGKFNNNKKGGSLLYANKEGVIVINKPFKEVIKDVVSSTKEDVIIGKVDIEDRTEEAEVVLLWQEAIHRNYLKIRGGKQ